MHWCANIVCGREGTCEAVLLRAGEPILGLKEMMRRRGAVSEMLLAAGPARLAQALGIGKEHNGASLLRGGTFWCAEDEKTDGLRSGEITETVRIGLGLGRGEDLPWRFSVPNNPYVSRRR
jgi:DNA-3-methyladenine glycosylase